eukprot:1305840-Rhodomonas_salina.1
MPPSGSSASGLLAPPRASQHPTSHNARGRQQRVPRVFVVVGVVGVRVRLVRGGHGWAAQQGCQALTRD